MATRAGTAGKVAVELVAENLKKSAQAKSANQAALLAQPNKQGSGAAGAQSAEQPAKRRKRERILPKASDVDESETLSSTIESDQLLSLASLMLDRLSSGSHSRPDGVKLPIAGLDEQRNELQSFLLSVATAQENNSLLLVGPPGSGKRAVLRDALQTLRVRFAERHAAASGASSSSSSQAPASTSDSDTPFRLVWLQGAALSDDAAALREISRQLSIDVKVAALSEPSGGGSPGRTPQPVRHGAGAAAGASPALPGSRLQPGRGDGSDGDDDDDDDGAGGGQGGGGAGSSVYHGTGASTSLLLSPPRMLREREARGIWPGLSTFAHVAAPGGDREAAARILGTGASVANALLFGGSRQADADAAVALRAAVVGADDADDGGGAYGSDDEEGEDGGNGGRGGQDASTVPGGGEGPSTVSSPHGSSTIAGRKRGRGGRGASPVDGSPASPSGAGSPAARKGAAGLTYSKLKMGLNRHAFELHLRFVVDTLREGRSGGVPVFIVIEDFDVFARRTKQTLLYNLLDLTASANVHLAMIGLTSRLDVLSLLEKRLASRFSHRQMLFTHPSAAHLRTLAEAALALPPRVAAVLPQGFVSAWTAGAVKVARDPVLLSVIEHCYRSNRGAPHLLAWLSEALERVGPAQSVPAPQLLPSAADARAAIIPLGGDDASRVSALASLPLPEVLLLAGMAHVELRHVSTHGSGLVEGHVAASSSAAARAGAPQYNFSVVYHEVTSAFKGTAASAVRQATQNATAAAAAEPAGKGASSSSSSSGSSSGSSSSSLPDSAVMLPDATSTLSRWAIDRAVALRAFERLVDSDLVRFTPRSVTAGDAARSSAGAGAGVGLWSGGSLTRDRSDLAHQPCMLLLDPNALLGAVRSNALQLPAEVRAWVLKGSHLAA